MDRKEECLMGRRERRALAAHLAGQPRRVRYCPAHGEELSGGPVLYHCPAGRLGHGVTAADLEQAAEAGQAVATVSGAVLAGCGSSSSADSQAPLFQSASQVALTCGSVVPDGSALASVIRMLAADGRVIGGNWAEAEAEATGDVNGPASLSAAQGKPGSSGD
jgi:hypothetical protein